MSDELKQEVERLGHYYRQHKIYKMIETHPNFVAEDFAKLLAKLHKEIEQNG